MNNRQGIKNFFGDAKKFLPLLINLTARDFKVKYRRSVLGVFWSVLNPLLNMLVISAVFGALLNIRMKDFTVYYIVGWSIWNFFSESTSNSLNSILAGASLIKKVYLPKYVFPLQKCLFALINFGFSMIAVIPVMLIQKVYPTWTAFLAPLPVLYCFVFSIGFSLILSALTVYFRDIQHLYSVLLVIWMYLTPIVYPVEMVKNNALLMTVIEYNPLYHFVVYFRCVMYQGIVPSLTENLICIAIAVGTLAIGCLVFSKAQKKFILHI
ncbi:MAG: ABC transporter permease [Clostridia bacterium]|nr:ABC transporter permease [Clostridia bacterium]